jgi:hypothetical protein
LTHSFALYDQRHPTARPYVQHRCARARTDLGCLSPNPSPEDWQLCVKHLYEVFIYSLASYEGRLRATPDLQVKFETMYPTYGPLRVAQKTFEPR